MPGCKSLYRRDEGATAIVVAILLVVLFGMGALVLDVGNLFWERRQLQNGGDAGSLAVAQDIARLVVDPAGSPPPVGDLGPPFLDTADHYADRNSAHEEADIDDLTLSQVDNKSLSEAGEVNVTTLVSGGELFHWLAPVLGFDSSPVRAAASAIYGSLVAGKAFPFAACEDLWEIHGPPASTLVEIHYKGTGQTPADTDCDVDGNFQPGDNPGNFGWLDNTGECETEFDFRDGADTGEATGDTGADIPSPCRDDVDQIENDILAHISNPANDLPVRVIPVFSRVEDPGNNATYTLTRFAAFEFSGVAMKGGQNTVVPPGWTQEIPHCQSNGANHLCVQGRFLQEVAPGAVDPDFNSDVLGVKLIE